MGVILFVVLKILIHSTTDSKELALTYKTNGEVPYKWEYKIEDESIVEFVKTKDITSKEDKVTIKDDKNKNISLNGIS